MHIRRPNHSLLIHLLRGAGAILPSLALMTAFLWAHLAPVAHGEQSIPPTHVRPSSKELARMFAQARSQLVRLGNLVALPGEEAPASDSFVPHMPLAERLAMLDKVELDLETVTRHQPSPEAWELLGATRLLQFRPDAAAEAFELSLAMDEQRASAHLYLVGAYMDTGRYDAARQALEDYLTIFPEADEHGLVLLADIALHEHDAEAMEETARRLLERDPQGLEGRLTQAAALTLRGQWQAAEQSFADIAADHPDLAVQIEAFRERLFVYKR